jgi:hypothetical protein
MADTTTETPSLLTYCNQQGIDLLALAPGRYDQVLKEYCTLFPDSEGAQQKRLSDEWSQTHVIVSVKPTFSTPEAAGTFLRFNAFLKATGMGRIRQGRVFKKTSGALRPRRRVTDTGALKK